MKALLQRAKDAKVVINNETVGKIDHGIVVFLGVADDDSNDDLDYLVRKIVNLRIFEDDEGKMNRSLLDTGGSILSISQFTLHADTRKGRRPSFIKAAHPEEAIEMYNQFNDELIKQGVPVETGVFGEMMDVELTNVGPVTIIIDSKEK